MEIENKVNLKFCGRMSAKEGEKDKKDTKTPQEEEQIILGNTIAVDNKPVRGETANKVVIDERHEWDGEGLTKSSTKDEESED